MAKREKAKQDSAPQHTAPAIEQAANATGATNGTVAQAGSNEPAKDASSVSEGTAGQEFVTVSFPLPAGIPEETLRAASIVVKARPERGRWRAGRQFTREETAIPFGDLSDAQLEALTGDPELVVTVRIPKP